MKNSNENSNPRVLDTSALVHDPKSLLAYSEDVYICLTVLEELDNLKERTNKSVSADARVCIRMLEDIINGHSAEEMEAGILLPSTETAKRGKLFIGISTLLMIFYLVPIFGYVPLAFIAIRKLYKIDPDLFRGTLIRVSIIIIFIEAFLIYRFTWYYFLKFGEILDTGRFNGDLVYLYSSEVILVTFFIIIQIGQWGEDSEIINTLDKSDLWVTNSNVEENGIFKSNSEIVNDSFNNHQGLLNQT